MKLSEFAASFGGNVDHVLGESAKHAEKEFNSWVSETPLPSKYASRGVPFFLILHVFLVRLIESVQSC